LSKKVSLRVKWVKRNVKAQSVKNGVGYAN
jgi:hypothetical protein